MKHDSCGIPTDVTFQIEEDGQLHEVKAHKMIVAMVSDTFKTMFYSTQVGDKNANIIKVEKTTAPAFRILMDAVYDVKSIGESLSGKSVDEVFNVVNLIERYQIKELMEAAKEALDNYPVTEDNVLEVAGDALEYSKMFETKVHQLLLKCAKFLMPKMKDFNYMVSYAAGNKRRKVEFATLVALMNDIKPPECPNCKNEVCRDGEVVKHDEFGEGLLVTSNRAIGNFWANYDYGTGRVTKVEAAHVTVETIKAEATSGGFDGGRYPKAYNNTPRFLFRCN